MSQDNFFGGFVVGTLFGGIVGGVAGALVASKLSSADSTDRSTSLRDTKQPSLDLSSEEGIETARRNLEDKIARLNEAIDDVQHQLEGVENMNGGTFHDNGEQAINQN
ncbi:MAG: hypothetical protein VKL39_10315 [Leptolyngbyaceae bacterium]|nr:hypothetical protein [Leptolyngbyaceae bacterium]